MYVHIMYTLCFLLKFVLHYDRKYIDCIHACTHVCNVHTCTYIILCMRTSPASLSAGVVEDKKMFFSRSALLVSGSLCN